MIGSIAGSVLGGFVLVPLLGTQTTLLLLGLTSAAMAGLFLATTEQPGWLRGAAAAMGHMPSPGAAPDGKLSQDQIARGVLAEMYPLPTWHVIPPGDVFRVFERGGRRGGLLVDELIGQEDIVVKQFDAARDGLGLFTGATILADGAPALIMAP